MYKNNVTQKAMLVLTILFAVSFAQIVFVENFDYAANTNLTASGWTAHSGSGTNAIKVYSPGLAYTGYAGSGIGNAAKVDTAGEDVNKTFTSTVNSGTVYTAFLLNVQKATSTSDYFFHLSTSPLNTYEFVGRMFIKKDASSSNFAIGLGKRQSDTSYTGFTYALNTTYLVVVKWQIVSGDSNDRLSLFVFSSGVPTTEPGTPTVGPFYPTSTDPAHIGAVALRQGTAASAPRVIIDGIRAATNWNSALSGIEEDNLIQTPKKLNINVNPNPFTNTTNINFNINPSNIKNIKIYDVTGNLVTTMAQPNTNQISWNGRNRNNELVAPGVYFINIETTKGFKVVKVLLSK